jgi:filamentous hemagglutinin family protein
MKSLPLPSTIALLSLLLLLHPEANAQVTADGTLSTQVNSTDGRNFVIENGDRAGNNLFHSFREFSIPTGGSATFNNAIDVQNIFSRVTGGSISNIDGLIRANGSANLFLLNPNGIVFGSKASLNIGGSFIGTTANSIRFADAVEFTATPSSSLLTLNVPTGLQFGSQTGSITNRSQVLSRRGTPAGLQVRPGQAIDLIGGDLTFDGGRVTASAGHLELGSVAPNSFVSIIPTALGFRFGYDQVQSFGRIQILRGSGADTTGVGGGSIQVRAAQFRIGNLSSVSSNTLGNQNGRAIDISTTDSVEILGISPNLQTRYGITATVLSGATGNGSSIEVTTPRLYIRDGQISSANLGSGNSGNINIRANDIRLVYVSIEGTTDNERTPAGFLSGVLPGASGNGGSILVRGDRLLLENGALIGTSTFGQGNAGNISVRVGQIDIMGTRLNGVSSGIKTDVPFAGATGQGGNLQIQADQLRLLQGGQISTVTTGSGNAGDARINARRIEIAGISANSNRMGVFQPSSITAAALPSSTVVLPGSTEPPAGSVRTGSAGSINITTQDLWVRDRGEMTVNNLTRFGNAGNINVRASSIRLDNGSLEANVQNGNRGNINLDTDSGTIFLRRGSQIITNAQGQARGGNIDLRSDFLIALENSDISANAENNFGGQVVINAQGVFGTAFRPQPTLASDITASSERGAEFGGSVEFNVPSVDPSQGLSALPEPVFDSSQQIAQTCNADQTSQFVATGRGGLPENPTQAMGSDRPWSDLRPLNDIKPAAVSVNSDSPITEASTFRVNDRGQVILVAIGAIESVSQPSTCSSQGAFNPME